MTDDLTAAPPIPRSFLGYLSSFGPGLVVVLTWLGAGDIVDMGVAGGNYGYSLMWVLVLAVVMRYLFVSLIAKYQLCNQHQEGVLDGLVRLHPAYGPLLLAAAILMGHVYGAYMTVGIGEVCRNVTGRGETWQWATMWSVVAVIFVFRSAYQRMEFLFKALMGVLSISFVGTALWVGPDVSGIARGLATIEMPEQSGQFGPLMVAMAMIGAVGGSLMNLVYPYFLESKGWRGPQYRRLQQYDFLLAVAVMMVLNLSVWILGAELLYPHGLTIASLDDLPWLLSMILGPNGRTLFYLGIFAAIYTSLIGHALGLGCLGSHAFQCMKTGGGTTHRDYRGTTLYRGIVVWCLVSPLIWTAPGMPGFVRLTLVINGAQVVMLPLIAGGLWRITASSQFIGTSFRNRWWENLVMAVLFALAVSGAAGSVRSMLSSGDAQATAVLTPDQLAEHFDNLGATIERNETNEIVGLTLTGSQVTNDDLKGLEPLAQLQTLIVADCRITDIGLYHLKALSHLRRIDLRGTDVTTNGIATLNQSLPNCEIDY